MRLMASRTLLQEGRDPRPQHPRFGPALRV